MHRHYGWYGDPAIWAAVQLPDRGALGVVLCPPLGQEGVIAYRGLRLLADQLQNRGIASVRYDPPGHGDAAPSDDPESVFEGARRGSELLRACGCSQICFLGLSSAALIASEVAEPDDLLVLWSPQPSGRSWLRRARGLATIELGTDRISDGIESLIGLELTQQAASRLGAVTLRLPSEAAALVAVREGEVTPPGLAGAQVIEVPGTAEFLDTPSMSSVLPVSAITTIADWLAAQVSGTAVALTPPPLRPELKVGKAVERIRWLGPNGLFAIECRPRDAASEVPVVLLHSGAAEHRVGAGNYQVELARLLAGDGAASVRADRRSTGETGTVRPEDPSLFYSEEWMADQDAIIAALGIQGDRLALTGLCAGGWLAGQRTIENPRLIVDIHPLEYRIDPAPPGEYVDEITTEADPLPGKGALREWYRRSAPVWLRQLRDRWKGRAGAGPFLASTAQRADRTVLIFSDLEKMIFDRRGGPRAMAKLASIEAIEVGGSDHALYARPTRQRVIAEVRRQVAQAFNLGSTTAEPPHTEPRSFAP